MNIREIEAAMKVLDQTAENVRDDYINTNGPTQKELDDTYGQMLKDIASVRDELQRQIDQLEDEYPIDWQQEETNQLALSCEKRVADEQAAELAARKKITINCDRPLGEGEMEHLIGEAKLMQITGDTKSWVGDGMLHMCIGGDEFHFVDQTNLEEKK